MINDPDDPSSFDPNANFDPNSANVPDALKPKKDRVLTRDQIKLRMYSNFGIEEDELDTLFPDIQNLTKFYEQALKLSKIENVKDLIEGKKVKQDNYKLSKNEKVALRDFELNKAREDRQRAGKQAAQKKLSKQIADAQKQAPITTPSPDPQPEKTAEQQMEEIMSAGSHLPEDDQASEEDIFESLKLIGEMREEKKKNKKK